MLLIANWVDAWQDPVMRHAMFIHFPIVLSCVLALLALLAALAWGRWRRGLAIICLVGYALLVVSAFLAENAGGDAHQAVEGSAGVAVEAMIVAHGEAGERVWWFSVCIALVLIVSLFGSRLWQQCWRWGFAVLSLCLVVYVGWVADLGGHLVYAEGVGMPPAAIERAIKIQQSAKQPSQEGQVEKASVAPDPRAVFFTKSVRPILSKYCWKCHNTAEDDDPAGGLDLTSISGVLKGGAGGPVVLVGNPAQSKLVRVVRWEIADLHMPPKKPQLSKDDIEALATWIREGVIWQGE